MSNIIAIAAIGAQTRALGRGNDLIWKLPTDLAHFKAVTNGHPIIMGSKTWESLPETVRPLPNRTNIVLSRECPRGTLGHEVVCVESPEAALAVAKEAPGSDEIFIVGGGQIYTLFLRLCDELNLTLIEESVPTEADVLFPEYEHLFKEVSRESHEENGIAFAFTLWHPHV